MKKVIAQCPNGHDVEIPFVDGEYQVIGTHCPQCDYHTTGGCYRDGTGLHWITAKDAALSEAEFQRQLASKNFRESWLYD